MSLNIRQKASRISQSTRLKLKLKLKLKIEVSLCENYQCKNNWWGQPLLPEILDQTDHVGAKSPIFDLFSLV